MTWKVLLSERASKFLGRNRRAEEKVFTAIGAAIRKFQGENINVDIKKLAGEWAGFYRIRKGDLRIIAEFDFDGGSVFIEVIDWRGGVYK